MTAVILKTCAKVVNLIVPTVIAVWPSANSKTLGALESYHLLHRVNLIQLDY